MFGKRRNQRWLPITGSRYEITYNSASIHDINEIPTAAPMFSTSGNTIRLLRRMLDLRKREKSKMAAKWRDKFNYWSMFGTARGFIWRPFKGCKYDTTYIFTNVIMFGASVIFILLNSISLRYLISQIFRTVVMRYFRLRYALFHIYFRLVTAIFDLSPICTSGILRSTLVMLPVLENMGTTIGISLLLRTQPKIQYVLPVHGRHFDFWHGFLSSVNFVIGGKSAVFKNKYR